MKYLTEEQLGSAAGAPSAAGRPMFFFRELRNLLQRPQQILLFWNWKSACLSVVLRVPIFLAAASRRGLSAIVSAVLTECLVCMITAGFYGAIAQRLKNAKPEWLVLVFLTVVVPAVFQSVEFLLHWFHGTPHLQIAEIVSLVLSGLSSLFNWYSMRRGALLVRGEGDTFGSDLLRLPRLLMTFLTALPRSLRDSRRIPGAN